jgi:hypothetical protein
MLKPEVIWTRHCCKMVTLPHAHTHTRTQNLVAELRVTELYLHSHLHLYGVLLNYLSSVINLSYQ